MNVGREGEPVQIVEDAALEFRPAPLAIVILDPQQHSSRQRACDPPDPLGVENVTEMEPAGRGRREPRERGRRQTPNECCDVELIGNQQNRQSVSGS